MHDFDLTLESPCDPGAQVRVSRTAGSEVPVRLRLLGYDGCEFESDERFAAGEQVGIHIYRMGWIRARVVSSHLRTVVAEFVKESPV